MNLKWEEKITLQNPTNFDKNSPENKITTLKWLAVKKKVTDPTNFDKNYHQNKITTLNWLAGKNGYRIQQTLT